MYALYSERDGKVRYVGQTGGTRERLMQRSHFRIYRWDGEHPRSTRPRTQLPPARRYMRLFKDNRPSRVAQFVERVPMVEGRLERKASTVTAYAWLIWEKGRLGS